MQVLVKPTDLHFWSAATYNDHQV